MSDEMWIRVRPIVERALELSGPEREAWLCKECGDDLRLRQEVERYLGVVDIEDDFLEPPQHAMEPDGHPAGHNVGEFEILGEIGRGGMAVVYRAAQGRLQREVALKVFVSNLTTRPEQVERFHREGRAAAKLQHPGIVEIYDVGQTGQTYWIAMEMIVGHDLREEILRLRQPSRGESFLPATDSGERIRAVASLCRDVACALQSSHGQNVIHRDIKPSNLLLRPDGRVKLVDFGLAFDVAAPALNQLTRTGEFAGTPHYVSPEQARVSQQPIDHRTDVFSLGVVMYELLTLVRPFEGETATDVLHAIRSADPRRPRKINRRIPLDLELICLTAMARSVDDRYATASALATDLDLFLNHEAPLAKAPSPLLSFLRRVRGHRAALLITGILFLGLALGMWIHSMDAAAKHRERLSESLRELSKIDGWEQEPGIVPIRLLLDARAAASELGGQDSRVEVARVITGRFEALWESWQGSSLAGIAQGLRARPTNAVDSIDTVMVLRRVRSLQELGILFPERTVDLPLESLEPRITVSATAESGAERSGRVSYREIHGVTGQPGPLRELGRLPLRSKSLPQGFHRIILDVDGIGRREFTRLILRGRPDTKLEYRSHPRHTDVGDMVRIDGGTLSLRDDPILLNPLNRRVVEVEAFWIDRHEVTNGEYREFLAANPDHPHPDHWDRLDPARHDDFPVVWVSWNDAARYAEWRGKRLLTAAEWTLAARGPEGRLYPWGNEAGGLPGNLRGKLRKQGEDLVAYYLLSAQPVGSHPAAATPEGVQDMYGNVSEWTESVLAERIGDRFEPRPHLRIILGRGWDAIARGKGGTLDKIQQAGPEAGYENYIRGFRCGRSATR